MVQYNEVQLMYSCAAFVPSNVYMDRIYRIKKDSKGFFFTDGNYQEHADIEYIQMLFSPKDTEISWKDVSFTDEVKANKKQ